MAYGVETSKSLARAVERPRISRSQGFFSGLAFAAVMSACGWALYVNLFESRPVDVVAAPTVTVLAAKPAAANTAQERPAGRQKRGLLIAPVFDIALIDPARSFGLPPVSFSHGVSKKPALQPAAPIVHVVHSVPLPTPRPAALAALANKLPATDDAFQKLFGKRDSTLTLAYAPADGGVSGDGRSVTSAKLQNDGQTAIYDISARAVYLPDGTKLEAHSGLGPRMDDPRYVHVRMHGATPPHVYDLAPREALFHGVEALRMHPVGGSEAIFGRTGLLTHSYLLGPNGDSNGCVSFKDYDAFLQAYKSGKVKRLIVVASVDDPQLDLRVAERRPARIAAARPSFEVSAPPADDRYFPAFSSSLASRTSSSARSLN